MSHAIQHVAFAANYLFLQQHSKVVKPTKRLKSTIEPTVKAASLLIYWNALFVIFNTLVNQKHHSAIGSITIEKMLKTPMPYQLANISTGTVMTLKITKKSLS